MAHDPSGSHGPTACAVDWCIIDDRCWSRFRFHRKFAVPDHCRHDWSDQPQRKRSRAISAIEQAALSHIVPSRLRTAIFAWYTVSGAFATGIGSLFSGTLAQFLQTGVFGNVESYRTIVVLYAGGGAVLAFLFCRLSSATEIAPLDTTSTPRRTVLGIGHSRGLVWKLSSLFALDSFAGGFVIQSFAAYWFYLRFGVNPGTLGSIFFGANIFAGISALLASRLASRFGLVNTMVFTHLPSNVLLILVPLMPTLSFAVLVLFLRFSISQMDVPTRQSYMMAVVRPEERSATAGITGVARTTGAAVAPLFAGFLFARPALMSAPFFIARALKIVHDLLLYRGFVSLRPPEEMTETE